MVTSNSPLANCLVITMFTFGYTFFPYLISKNERTDGIKPFVDRIVFGWTLAVITWSLTIHPIRYIFDR